MPASPGPVLPKDMTMRQWAEFLTQSGLLADRTQKEFTPTSWGGFSADPTAAVSYYDFGSIVMLWADTDIVGTSDDVTFTLSGVPSALIPSRLTTTASSGGMVNNATPALGQVYIYGGSSGFAGQIHFSILRTDVVANFAVPSTVGWTASGNKGLAAGWLITYPK